MHCGLEIDLHLTPGLKNDNFISELLANLAVYHLQQERGVPVQWRVLRMEESHHHHFRFVVRHLASPLNIGLAHAVKKTLSNLSNENEEELSRRFHEVKAKGLNPSPLCPVQGSPDL
ncbi:MAG: hypothetical protein M1144_05605 [Candidatus Thermoplasmatota archaeon]|nr:hypothetical protein [Candidatus Thermoplasmatota archaeon]